VLAGERCTNEDITYESAKGRIWSATYIPEFQRGEVVGFYIMSQDITETRLRENQMRSEVMRDALTGLPNRRALHEQLDLVTIAARESDQPFALFFLDLDGFKNVNDRYGHDAGDDLLRQVARRLKKTTRANDFICRLAGDEFVLLARGTQSASACSRIAQDVCRAIAREFVLGDVTAHIGTSVGIAICAAGANESADSILAKADRAMYEAKRKGRNGFRFASLTEDVSDPLQN
jgi:diguanylate cyclase